MITVNKIISDYIDRSPFLEQLIADQLINISALARKIKPEIERKLMKRVSDSSVIMSLNRMVPDISKNNNIHFSIDGTINDLTVKSNITEFTYRNSDTILRCHSELLRGEGREEAGFLTVTRGSFETTLLTGGESAKHVKAIFGKEKLISTIEGLSAVILKLPSSSYNSPGIYYDILKQLAWRNINVVEVVSTLNEFSIIIKSEDIDTAFSVLKSHLMK